MSSSKKRFVILALMFAAVSVLAVWRLGPPSIERIIGAGERAAERTHEGFARTRAVDPGRSDRAWPVGTRRTYAVEFASSVDFPEKKEASGATIHGRGMLELISLEDGARTILRGSLAGASFGLAESSAKKSALPPSLPSEVARPFAVQLDPDLRIERVYFEPDLDPVAQAMLRSILGGAQFVRPASHRQSDRWSVEEADASGVATATYVRTGTERYTKKKRDYRDTAVEKSARDATAPLIESSSTYEVIESLNVIRRADIDQTMTARVMELAMTAQTQGTLALMQTQQVDAALDPAWLASLRGMTLNELIETPTKQDDTPLAAGVTFDGTLERVIATKGQDFDVADELAKLFRQRPGSIDEGLHTLRTRRDLLTEARTEIVAGFANANTDAGQAALLEVSRDPSMEPSLRRTAIMRLGLHEQPNAETMAGLQQLATEAEGDDRSTATLMLGSAARGAVSNGAHAEVSQGSVEYLQQGLSAAKTPAEQTLYLEALGNAGAKSNLTVVADALNSAEPSVRSSAVSALRFVKDPAAEAAMVRVAKTDPEHKVRRESVASLQYRDFTDSTREALGSVLHDEQNDSVREEALAILANNTHDPKARAQVEWTAKNDPSEELRKRAQQVLDDVDHVASKDEAHQDDPG